VSQWCHLLCDSGRHFRRHLDECKFIILFGAILVPVCHGLTGGWRMVASFAQATGRRPGFQRRDRPNHIIGMVILRVTWNLCTHGATRWPPGAAAGLAASAACSVWLFALATSVDGLWQFADCFSSASASHY
jgi:hypothetical protein